LRSLLIFPKLELLAYSLLVVPVVYGAAKLAGSGKHELVVPGIMVMLLLPLPPLLFWLYVLWPSRFYHSSAKAPRRSRAPSKSNDDELAVQQRKARLDLLGIGVAENPTLILRARNSASSDDSDSSNVKTLVGDIDFDVNAHDRRRPALGKAGDDARMPTAGARTVRLFDLVCQMHKL
jgi:hypothetical protein